MDEEKRQAEQRRLDQRWDVHTERMRASATTGIGAITILNSGSWIALLSQAEGLSQIENAGHALGLAMFCWGMGALLATSCWLFVYLNAGAQYQHDVDRENKGHRAAVDFTRWIGVLLAIAALGFFGRGVFALGNLLSSGGNA